VITLIEEGEGVFGGGGGGGFITTTASSWGSKLLKLKHGQVL